MNYACKERFTTWIDQKIGGAILGEVVIAEVHDAALLQVAALREELATAKRGLANCKVALDAQTHNYGVANLRLTAAEQRNSELVELLRSMSPWLQQIMARSQYDLEFMPVVRAALKPTESGASE